MLKRNTKEELLDGNMLLRNNLNNKTMNKNGEQVIKAIVNRLSDKNIRCDDTAIVTELRGLGKYELNQLITFGYIDEWMREQNENLNKQ